MSQKINILCIKFKIIYNNAANTVVCEGWHLHMENTCIVASFNKEVRVGTVNKRREDQRGNHKVQDYLQQHMRWLAFHSHMENMCTINASFNNEGKVGTVNKRRENQRGNQEWTIQKHWQHWVHKTQDENRKK
jgi:hypothetical protein